MIVRPPTPDELRFVFVSWVQSAAELVALRLDAERLQETIGARPIYRQTPFVDVTWARLLGPDYRPAFNRLVDALATTETTLVAEGEDGLLDGFVVTEGREVCHYVYVRLSARRRGVARALIEAAQLAPGCLYPCRPRTHRQDSALDLTRHVPTNWVCSPKLWVRGFKL